MELSSWQPIIEGGLAESRGCIWAGNVYDEAKEIAMSKRISVSSLKRFAKEQKLTMAILLAWDGELTHVVTWGQSVEECSKAADAGNSLKTAIGWPDSLHTQPSRVRKLQERIKELENELKG